MMNNINKSVIDWISITTFFTFIKDSTSFICRSGLDDVIFHLWMVTFWTFFFYYHFWLSSLLFLNLRLVFMKPLFVLFQFHCSWYRCTNKLLEWESVLTYMTCNEVIKSIKVDKTATDGTKISRKSVNICHSLYLKFSIYYCFVLL